MGLHSMASAYTVTAAAWECRHTRVNALYSGGARKSLMHLPYYEPSPPHIAAVIGSLQIYEFMLLSFFFVSYVCCWFVTPKH